MQNKMQIYFCTLLYLYPNNRRKRAVYKVQIKRWNLSMVVAASEATSYTEAASNTVNHESLRD